MSHGAPRLGSTVNRFSHSGLVRRTYGPQSTDANGYVVPGAIVDTPFSGHAFPATGAVLARAQDLQITGRLIEVHTTSPIKLADRVTGERGDVIVYDGDTFEAQFDAEWTGGPAGARDYRAIGANQVVR